MHHLPPLALSEPKKAVVVMSGERRRAIVFTSTAAPLTAHALAGSTYDVLGNSGVTMALPGWFLTASVLRAVALSASRRIRDSPSACR